MSTRADCHRMDESSSSLDRLRVSCRQEAHSAHVFGDLAQCLARSLDVQIVLLSICGKNRYCHRGRQESTPAELAAAIRIADDFLSEEAGTITTTEPWPHPVLADHLVTAGSAPRSSFAGMRIRAAGHTIGTVCLFDRRPDAIRVILLEDMLWLAEAVVASVLARGC